MGCFGARSCVGGAGRVAIWRRLQVRVMIYSALVESVETHSDSLLYWCCVVCGRGRMWWASNLTSVAVIVKYVLGWIGGYEVDGLG